MPPDDSFTCAACRGTMTKDNFIAIATGSVSGGNHRYARCPHCAGFQLHPLPSHESNEAFETEQTAAQMASTDDNRLQYLRRRLARLRLPTSPPPSPAPRLLDVGCSTGRLMGLAHQAGWQVTGIEMSQALAMQARHHQPQAVVLVGDILQMELDDLPPFDAIVALDVIEHVLDPEEFLRRLHRLLVPGGQLLLQTPNARSLRARLYTSRWNMLIPQYHFHLFSSKGVVASLNRTGFKTDKISTASGSGTETGPADKAAQAKEKLLNLGKLGNALLIKATRK